MLLIERHLLRQFAESVAAVAIVLLLVTLGALFADLIAEIAKGKVPAGLLLSQLGLRSIRFLTLVLPLALFLGLLLSIGRMYAQSEMAVLGSIGIGPQRLWRPLLWVSLPIVIIVALASLWLAPMSAHRAKEMIEVANRSFLIAGLEPGRFVELPGKGGVLYVTDLTPDGTRFKQLFVQREHEGRLDIITAHEGSLNLVGETERYLRLKDGFRVEGAIGSRDFRMMRFEKNDVRVPDRESNADSDDLSADSTTALLAAHKPLAIAELHWRLAMPLFVVILA
ncbi:MAG: LPS export ABC transporter permease LptF, partial [Arenimonas sp.]